MLLILPRNIQVYEADRVAYADIAAGEWDLDRPQRTLDRWAAERKSSTSICCRRCAKPQQSGRNACISPPTVTSARKGTRRSRAGSRNTSQHTLSPDERAGTTEWLRGTAAECARLNHQRSSYMAHLFTLAEWRQILSLAGFELVESRGLLSLDLARFSHLFYFLESSGPNVFRDPFRSGRLGSIVRLLFGGAARYEDCREQYRSIMREVLAYELAHHAGEPFLDRTYLDAGIVAVKVRELPRGPRLAPGDAARRGAMY